MNTPELAEDIIETLHDAACAGEVAEVFVLYRGTGGQWSAGLASDDLAHLVDVATQTLAVAERPAANWTVN